MGLTSGCQDACMATAHHAYLTHCECDVIVRHFSESFAWQEQDYKALNYSYINDKTWCLVGHLGHASIAFILINLYVACIYYFWSSLEIDSIMLFAVLQLWSLSDQFFFSCEEYQCGFFYIKKT